MQDITHTGDPLSTAIDDIMAGLPKDVRDEITANAKRMVKEGRDAPALPEAPKDAAPEQYIEWAIDPISHRLKFSEKEERRQDVKSKQTVAFSKSDSGNAQRIAHRFGRDLRYCYQTGTWHIWDGVKWAEDKTGLIRMIALDTMVRVSDESNELPVDNRQDHIKFSARCLNKSMIENAISLTQSMVSVTLDDLNKDDFVLNVLNGTLNLKTWEFTAHRQADLITKCAGVEYLPEADCPVWKSHLNRIFDGDQKFISELQEIFGYCLMGGNPQEIILVCHGSGSNGKSVTREALSFVFGDYATNMNVQSIMAQKNSNGPRSDLVRLQGARLITTSESEANDRLAEGQVKVLTGADPITARAAYDKWESEFKVKGKIFFATNHKPKVYGQDPAIWRRLWLVPFAVTIPKEERDYALSDKLRGEGAGILNWLLTGFKRYYNRGHLPESEKIINASKAYQADSDLLGEFLSGFEITGRDEDCQITRADLYNSYKLSVDASEKPFPKSKFNQMMQERIGKEPKHDKRLGIVWVGIKIKNSGQQSINL